MKKTILSIVVFLLVALTFVSFRVRPAKATGTIYIRADGSIDPPTAPITTADNVTYLFTDNMVDSIVVERDNITVDGNGCTLQIPDVVNAKGIDITNRSYVTIRNTNILGIQSGIGEYGIWFSDSHNNVVTGNNITRCGWSAVYVSKNSQNNMISNNNLTESTSNIHDSAGIDFSAGWNRYNSIINNSIAHCSNGIVLPVGCDNNTVAGNTIRENTYRGLTITSCSDSEIYHNSFINNTDQVYVYNSVNSWDDGYPSGGNYWSDYAGTDIYHGSNQDEFGSDGIGDAPYSIDVDNVDHYPLMKPSPWEEHDVAVTMVQPSKPIVGEGQSMNVTVTVFNYGAHTESFVVSVHYNGLIDTHPIVLLSLESKTFTVVWDTTGVPLSNYTITATAEPVPGEASLNDNTRAGGRVCVVITGDVNGDGYVGIDDILEVASHFGLEIGNPEYDPVHDIIDDGYIGMDDIFAAASHFGEESP